MNKRDYYEVMEVAKTANEEEIKKSYRKLAVQYHPDKNPDDKTAEEKFKELGEAYEVLSDPQKRAAYDQMGHAAFDTRAMADQGFPSGFNNPRYIFSEFFKNRGNSFANMFDAGGFHFSFGGQGFPGASFSSTQIISQDIDIDLKKALLGGEIEVNISNIGKTIKFILPSPIQSGQQFRVRLSKENNNEIILQLVINVILPTLNDKQKKVIKKIL